MDYNRGSENPWQHEGSIGFIIVLIVPSSGDEYCASIIWHRPLHFRSTYPGAADSRPYGNTRFLLTRHLNLWLTTAESQYLGNGVIGEGKADGLKDKTEVLISETEGSETQIVGFGIVITPRFELANDRRSRVHGPGCYLS
jgi:hypothetical protein